MMRNNKKITIFTIVCIILLALSLNAFAATADTTAPVINSISINGNKDYKLGEKVYLNLDANDDISGINRIDISIQCLSVEDSQDPIVSTTSEIYDFNTSNPYFIIPSQLYSGSYTVDQIYIYDNNNNCRQYSNNENLWDQFEKLEYTLKFNIEAGGSDKVAPILNNISFDKTNMVYGEEITITANASDDMSGVRQIQVFLKNESIKDLISIFLEKDNTNKYIGKFKPYLNGTYELSHVLLDDNSYNDIVYYTDTFTGDVFENYKKIDKKSFNVTGGTDSFSDISIANMDFTYKQLSAPNIFKLRIKLIF